MARRRLDLELVRRGLVPSREEARRAVSEMRVTVGGALADKHGRLVAAGDPVVVSGSRPRFVSRGGEKLAAALDAFGLEPFDRVCLDVGASTGGFTDCLLQRGARRVYAVDVGRGQLHDRLRRDPRVVVMERVNARYLSPGDLDERASLATMDVSFISATKITPALRQVVEERSDLVLLVKPQFEAGRELVGRGGVVRDPEVRAVALAQVLKTLEEQGYHAEGVVESPLAGADGNIEFLAHLRS